MSVSLDFMISLFIFLIMIFSFYSLINHLNINYYEKLIKKSVLNHKAQYTSFYVLTNSYSIKYGEYYDYNIECVAGDKVYCESEGLMGEAPVYLRRGGGN